MRWMNLEPIIQSEVSQKEKNKYHNECIYIKFRKMVLMNVLAGQQWRRGHREQTCGHSGGRRGGTNGESSTETYTLPHVKQTARGKLLCNTGGSTPCSVTT